jgi:SAM-dependent methyltransferase
MPDFKQRSNQLEMLDLEVPPMKQVKRNYGEMAAVNRLLGGYSPLISQLKKWVSEHPEKSEWTILDVGCGMGDVLRQIDRVFNSDRFQYIGVDTNELAIDLARTQNRQERFTWLNEPYEEFERSVDVVLSSLFAHHLTDEELQAFIEWSDRCSKVGWIVSDLHRHPIGYYAIKGISRVLPTTRLFKNDAPLSVLRAFTREDFKTYTSDGAELRWHWAFRWTLTKSKI